LSADRSKQAGFLAGAGVTPAEASLFSVVHYGLVLPPDDLPRWAASPDYSIGGPVIVEACRAALGACVAKGWLQFIDEAALSRIAAEIRRAGLVGPVYGMPAVGGVDFTAAGAAMWHRLLGLLRDGRPRTPFAFTDIVRCREAKLFPSQAAALAEIAQARESWEDVEVSGPVTVGPWRARWWHRFPEGHRVEVEWRCRWEGHCGGGGGWCYTPRSPRWKEEPERWRPILARRGLDVAAWLVMAEVAGGADLPCYLAGRAADFPKRDYGVEVSADECRAALDVCLAAGWLRLVDAAAVTEIKALLWNEPAAVPLPDEIVGHLGSVDFTPAGAALYRQVNEECLGLGWDDGLCLQKELFREEHRYGATAQDILPALEDSRVKGEDVVACRVVPIGPWCVWWWERFPSGYRLELEVRGSDWGLP
jgi:hypothetical protein